MMRKWFWTVLVVATATALLAWWWRRLMPPEVAGPVDYLPPTCRELAFEAVPYIVCDVDLEKYDLKLRRADANDKPVGNLAALAAVEPFVLAMNAGMYHKDMTPVGLYVEDSKEESPLNLSDAPGNFFMKPNGVFFVDQNGDAGVLESSVYAASNVRPRLATQSGPMLVIDGKLHPRFEENGASRYIRNGVGTNGGKHVVFAISRQPVSLGSFARLFRDALGVKNALFFDGAISALHDGKKYLVGGGYPAGPMIAVTMKPGETTQ